MVLYTGWAGKLNGKVQVGGISNITFCSFFFSLRKNGGGCYDGTLGLRLYYAIFFCTRRYAKIQFTSHNFQTHCITASQSVGPQCFYFCAPLNPSPKGILSLFGKKKRKRDWDMPLGLEGVETCHYKGKSYIPHVSTLALIINYTIKLCLCSSDSHLGLGMRMSTCI